MRPALLASLLLAASVARGQAVGVLKYTPNEDERPVVTTATLKPSGSNFALFLKFDRAPWGTECKNRCANAIFYIDADDDPSTGLQAGPDRPFTGADLSVLVQGSREFGEVSTGAFLKVKVRQHDDTNKRIDDGDLIAELDHRKDRERLEVEGKEVHVLIDASLGTLPVAKSCRFIYAPSGAKPVVGKCKGFGGGEGGKVKVEKGLKPVKRTKNPYGDGG